LRLRARPSVGGSLHTTNVARMSARFIVVVMLSTFIGGSSTSSSASVGANPIRKVVNLLQAMQKKVTEEGAKAEELHQKFMCYCKNSGSTLGASIAAAEKKVPDLEASIQGAKERKKQVEAALKSNQEDRDSAKAAMKEATSLRQKEKATFDKSLSDSKANLAALGKAITAIDQGMAGSFLQSDAATALRSLLMGDQSMASADRQDVLAFLSGGHGSQYAPASGEISGILKTMSDEMSADQKNLVSTEEEAVTAYEGLMSAKKKEVSVLTKGIEAKMERVGSLGVEIATMENDLEDTAEGLAADKKFAADLKENCGKREGIHEKEKQMRATEVVALADTIKILNDDDALELFKKTLPSASVSLVQVQDSSAALRQRASEVLTSAQSRMRPGQHRHIDFVLLALRGRKVGFEKVVKLVDGLVATLNKEQQDDEHKKSFCEAQFDEADDKKKALEISISDTETVIEESKESLATLAEEIKAVKAGIVALDKAVEEATDQRKSEAAEFKDLVASNTAASELILFAKNRLQKFYNPRLYKAAPKRELSAEDRIYENEGGDVPTEAPGGIAGTGISALVQVSSKSRAAPGPPPAAAAAYKKKSEGSAGVMAMMDLLVQDLEKETTEAKVEEANAKKAYEKVMAESAAKRTEDSKSLTDKEAAQAELGSALQRSEATKKADTRELMGTMKYISSLKSECDWLLQYFDVRKQARADEIDSLQKAKAVLSGADFSLLQSGARARKFLQHA